MTNGSGSGRALKNGSPFQRHRANRGNKQDGNEEPAAGQTVRSEGSKGIPGVIAGLCFDGRRRIPRMRETLPHRLE